MSWARSFSLLDIGISSSNNYETSLLYFLNWLLCFNNVSLSCSCRWSLYLLRCHCYSNLGILCWNTSNDAYSVINIVGFCSLMTWSWSYSTFLNWFLCTWLWISTLGTILCCLLYWFRWSPFWHVCFHLIMLRGINYFIWRNLVNVHLLRVISRWKNDFIF